MNQTFMNQTIPLYWILLVVIFAVGVALGYVIIKTQKGWNPTAENESQTVEKSERYPWEFWLVIGMLVALISLILTILLPTIDQPNLGALTEPDRTFKNLHDYNALYLDNRKDILSIIITAFGAWIGAGAAYFFGRENLRVAAEGLLAMRRMSARELLSKTSIKQIPPTPIDWTVDKDTLVSEVRTKLDDDPSRWFIPVVKDDGSLETVINEEALWRFLLATEGQESPPLGSPPLPQEGKISDLLAYIETNPGLKRFNQIYVTVTMETTVGAANDLMESRKVYLAIVVTEGKPTHFFTTSEVRKLLLQGS